MLSYRPVYLPKQEQTQEQRSANVNQTPINTQPPQKQTVATHESNTLQQIATSINELKTDKHQPDVWADKFKPMIDAINLSSSKKIVRTPPIVKLNGQGLIWQRTINIIQGKFGSHKSRLAELICSLLIRSNYYDTDFCGLEREEFKEFSVAYVDTERNTTEQFPLAIQQVRRLAGRDQYQPYDHLIPFSLIHYSRTERLPAIKEFIEQLMKQCERHKFVLLDVVTDCIKDFNNSSESLELFDFLNQLINDHDITLLLIIHENPGTDKARGHIGTEAANKASTILQIGFEKGANNRDSDVIAVKLLKLRNGKKPDPTYMYYNETTHALAPASRDMINAVMEDKLETLHPEILTDCLGNYIENPTLQKLLIQKLNKKFGAHENTIKSRLKYIAEEKLIIYNCKGLPCYLEIDARKGCPTIYKLILVDKSE